MGRSSGKQCKEEAAPFIKYPAPGLQVTWEPQNHFGLKFNKDRWSVVADKNKVEFYYHVRF